MTSADFTQLLSGAFAGRVGGLLESALWSTPTVLKYVLGLLLLVNIRSWPLIWHCTSLCSISAISYSLTVSIGHVFSPIVHYRLRVLALSIRTSLLSKQKKLEAKDRFLQELCPVGKDPIKFVISVKSWAGTL